MKRLLTLAAALAAALPAAAQEVTRSIEQVAGDVYMMRNNFHNSLLIQTGDGVVRIDPINAEAGAWVNDNLDQVGGGSVTHLIWSHSHGDHGSGGDAHPGAVKIAHQATGGEVAGVAIDELVGDSHTLSVGSKTIELTNVGAGHDNHLLIAVVRPENVAFVVDIVTPWRLPFRDFPGADIDGYVRQIEAAQTLDFDILAPGHGNTGTKADLGEARAYVVELKAAVLDGLKAGKSLDDLKAEVTMAGYADFGQYEAWLPLNIEGMARFLQESGQVN